MTDRYLIAVAMLLSPLTAPAAIAQTSEGVPMADSPSPPRPLLRAEPPESGFHATAMHRATIFVRNRAKSMKLYRDILGMRPYFDNYWDSPPINAIMGTKSETLRATVLEGSGSALYGKLGIYQLSTASVRRAGPPSRSRRAEVGDVAVVFVVDDVDRLAARINAGGYVVVAPSTVLRHNPNHKVQGREMLFRDPDGILVNLIQPPVVNGATAQPK